MLYSGEEQVKLLNTLDEKIVLLEDLEVDNLIILPFNKTFASTGFEDFIKNILVDQLGIEHLVVGYNHQLGKDREGNFSKLKLLAEQYKFGLTGLDPYLFNNERVSSSRIRKYILEGNIVEAGDNLGYPFFLSGKVIGGNKKGRDIGFPTANISISDVHKIIPCNGVYAVFVTIEDKNFHGMMKTGTLVNFTVSLIAGEPLKIQLFMPNRMIRPWLVIKPLFSGCLIRRCTGT
ncbi:Bifunctional riboflavin kinase/FMN adenylyltransferase [subsurface metagenome]